MATLVLSSVGTALGGPVGAAVGALIGQSLDQQLLGSRSRGPRLGDLSVQTSSYGTQIPRVYGRMRVAGSVVWATDLAESAATTGAKGQPDTVYSYSVSFAVALSSRPVLDIGRVWADGKLIRDVDGVFKVPTTFRFYPGGEEQAVDPLIASIEGIGTTPAYRGLRSRFSRTWSWLNSATDCRSSLSKSLGMQIPQHWRRSCTTPRTE